MKNKQHKSKYDSDTVKVKLGRSVNNLQNYLADGFNPGELFIIPNARPLNEHNTMLRVLLVYEQMFKN